MGVVSLLQRYSRLVLVRNKPTTTPSALAPELTRPGVSRTTPTLSRRYAGTKVRRYPGYFVPSIHIAHGAIPSIASMPRATLRSPRRSSSCITPCMASVARALEIDEDIP